MSETSVQVPRGVLVALVSVLAASLMGLAFFMGRETVHPAPLPVAPPVSAVTVAPVVQPEITVTAPAVQTPPQEASAAVAPAHEEPEGRATVTMTPTTMGAPLTVASPTRPVPVATGAVPQPSATHAPPAVVSETTRAVAAYFRQVDTIEPGGLSDDPEKFANEIVQGALNGDSSGMDKLIHETEDSRQKLKSLHPPTPCADYHQQSVDMMDESVHVLQVMKNALKSNDAGALTSLAAQAQAMQERAKALKNTEAELKTRYGVGDNAATQDQTPPARKPSPRRIPSAHADG